MPYKIVQELPNPVKYHLPKHTQGIYKGAYNSDREDYRHPDQRKGKVSREETAPRIARSAVKKDYQKGDKRRLVKK